MRVNAGQQHQRCEICQGSGVYRGIYHLNGCVACNGVGVVHQSGEAMSLEQGIEYLRNQLAAHPQGRAPSVVLTDAEKYQQANTRGPGGSHYAGD